MAASPQASPRLCVKYFQYVEDKVKPLPFCLRPTRTLICFWMIDATLVQGINGMDSLAATLQVRLFHSRRMLDSFPNLFQCGQKASAASAIPTAASAILTVGLSEQSASCPMLPWCKTRFHTYFSANRKNLQLLPFRLQLLPF